MLWLRKAALLFGRFGVNRLVALDGQRVYAVGVLGDDTRLGEVDGLAVADALAFEQDFAGFALQLPNYICLP